MILKRLHIIGIDTGPKDIKIENDIITEVSETELTGYSGEVVMNFDNCIGFPGLINSHDHLEFNLYPQLGHKIYQDYVEWGDDIHETDKEIIDSIEAIPLNLRLKYGIIKNLICGITAVAQHGAYNSCLDNSPISVIRTGTCIHSVQLGGNWGLKLNYVKNLEPYIIHIGEGIDAESYDEINELIRWNLFNRKLIGIHVIAMTVDQSSHFEALVWCPLSNIFLFNKTAAIKSLKENTNILFGTDSTLTADWNIWNHLRKARNLKLLNDEELLSSLTDKASNVWDIKNSGEISPGKKADIVVAKQKSGNLFDSFYSTNPEDIFLVIKNGKMILFDESLKEQFSSFLNPSMNFDVIRINGIAKFVDYDIQKIIDEIHKYNSSVSISIFDFH